MKETFYWRFIVDDPTREHVYEVDCGEKSLIPKFQRHGGSSEQGQADLNYMPVLALG